MLSDWKYTHMPIGWMGFFCDWVIIRVQYSTTRTRYSDEAGVTHQDVTTLPLCFYKRVYSINLPSSISPTHPRVKVQPTYFCIFYYC